MPSNAASSTTPRTDGASRHVLLAGLWAGIAATAAMTVLMLIAKVAGISPMPKPIPIAIAARLLGTATAPPVLMIVGAVSHFAYGAIFGVALAAYGRPVTVARGLLLGSLLWLVMQVAWLPFLGWGIFGHVITPRIAGATLVLHLVYGGTLGWLLARTNSAGA